MAYIHPHIDDPLPSYETLRPCLMNMSTKYSVVPHQLRFSRWTVYQQDSRTIQLNRHLLVDSLHPQLIQVEARAMAVMVPANEENLPVQPVEEVDCAFERSHVEVAEMVD